MTEPLPNARSRRQILTAAGAGLGLLAMPAIIRPVVAQPVPGCDGPVRTDGRIFASPNFDRFRDPERPAICGVRPYRSGGPRIEIEPAIGVAEGKTIIHNYGHGGAGITLGFGSAMAVAELLEQVLARRRSEGRRGLPNVAVLGAGIAGLAVAYELRRRRDWQDMRVTVYADRPIDRTTSAIAGGQFEPSGLRLGMMSAEPVALVRRLITLSHQRLVPLMGKEYGIYERRNYAFDRVDALDTLVPRSVIPEPRRGILPFTQMIARGVCGYEYRTWLLEPPTLLPRLQRHARQRGARFLFNRRFASLRDVLALREPVIINCMGLSARERSLFNDQAVSPDKGTLVILRSDGSQRYLFSGGCGGFNTYVFARSNDIVVGGSNQLGRDDLVPDPTVWRPFVARAENVFDGRPGNCS